MNSIRRMVLVLLVLVLALVAAACGGGEEQDFTPSVGQTEGTEPDSAAAESTDEPTQEATEEPTEGSADATEAAGGDWAEIEEAARQEGELILYTATHDGINVAEIEAFNEQYPEITVSHTRLISGELTTRFASETESGAPSADIIKIADNVLLEDHPEWFVPLDEETIPSLENVPDQFVKDHYVHMMVGPFVITYHQEQLEDPPAMWEDLVDEQYQGQGMLADPRSSGAFMAVFSELLDVYGPEYLEALRDNGYEFYDSSATAVQQVAAGEVAFVGPGQAAHSKELRDAGAPLDTVRLEPTIALTHIAAVAEDAQNPNAALVYLNWLLTREGQEAACQGEYEAIAAEDLPDCPQAPADLTIFDPIRGQEQADQINQLLGLE